MLGQLHASMFNQCSASWIHSSLNNDWNRWACFGGSGLKCGHWYAMGFRLVGDRLPLVLVLPALRGRRLTISYRHLSISSLWLSWRERELLCWMTTPSARTLTESRLVSAPLGMWSSESRKMKVIQVSVRVTILALMLEAARWMSGISFWKLSHLVCRNFSTCSGAGAIICLDDTGGNSKKLGRVGGVI